MTDQTTTPEAEESTASNSTQLLCNEIEQEIKLILEELMKKEPPKNVGILAGPVHFNHAYRDICNVIEAKIINA